MTGRSSVFPGIEKRNRREFREKKNGEEGCMAGLLDTCHIDLKVHITQDNHAGTAMIISWVTIVEPGSSSVLYRTSEDNLNCSAKGKHSQYTFYKYTSGYISSLYNQEAEGTEETLRKFWFRTPLKSGPDVPYTFGLIGDLGQSFDSNLTLAHYESDSKARAMLFVGDLTYTDNYPYHDNTRWDTWARFVERNLAYQPWIWTAANHEIGFAPELLQQQMVPAEQQHSSQLQPTESKLVRTHEED